VFFLFLSLPVPVFPSTPSRLHGATRVGPSLIRARTCAREVATPTTLWASRDKYLYTLRNLLMIFVSLFAFPSFAFSQSIFLFFLTVNSVLVVNSPLVPRSPMGESSRDAYGTQQRVVFSSTFPSVAPSPFLSPSFEDQPRSPFFFKTRAFRSSSRMRKFTIILTWNTFPPLPSLPLSFSPRRGRNLSQQLIAPLPGGSRRDPHWNPFSR